MVGSGWTPFVGYARTAYRQAQPGDLVAWAFAVWLVERADPLAADPLDVDGGPRWSLRLRRRHGPPHPREQAPRLIGVSVPEWYTWTIVCGPYPLCGCHQHPWPCRQMVTDQAVADEARRLEVLLGRLLPGVCLACGEPVTRRQKAVEFPGENLLVPGGPAALFHVGRQRCRGRAQTYEERRLAHNPTLTRLCTCPGIRFRHDQPPPGRADGGLVGCTAGPGCTGHHWGPGTWCGTRLYLDGGQVRPTSWCGAEGCQGPLTT